MVFFSAARTIPSLLIMPRAMPAWEMASIAYSTWYSRPNNLEISFLFWSTFRRKYSCLGIVTAGHANFLEKLYRNRISNRSKLVSHTNYEYENHNAECFNRSTQIDCFERAKKAIGQLGSSAPYFRSWSLYSGRQLESHLLLLVSTSIIWLNFFYEYLSIFESQWKLFKS